MQLIPILLHNRKSEVTVPEVTASWSEEAIVSQLEITVPKIRKISIASEVIRSPLMIMMLTLLITVVLSMLYKTSTGQMQHSILIDT